MSVSADSVEMQAATRVSCPGKVFMAGGYVVLEQPNRGYVLATTARFETSVQSSKGIAGENEATKITVESPQYRQTIEIEATPVKESADVKVVRTNGSKNPYVEQTVSVAVAAARVLRKRWEFAEDLKEVFLASEGPKSLSEAELKEIVAYHFRFAEEKFLGSTNVVAAKVLAAAKALSASPERVAALNPALASVQSFDDVDTSTIVSMSPGAEALSKGETQVPVVAAMPSSMSIMLRADNDFYSQQSHLAARGLPYNTSSLATLEPYMPCINESGDVEVSKTGLGSSAAMVSSLVSAVILDLFPAFKDHVNLDTLHSVAQLAHGVIQGKIGSGFDVCVALFGSMRYVRYDPKGLEDPLNRLCEARDASAATPTDAILASLSRLDYETTPFALPPRLQLMCGDVRGGSESPSMSRDVLKWRKSAPPEELMYWDLLIASNDAVASCVETLHKMAVADRAAYDHMLDVFASTGEAGPALKALHDAFAEVRVCLRKIGEFAKVPIEPTSQTELCDKTEGQPGVVMSGVPGAGGFDAVFAVVVDTSRAAVERFWESLPAPTQVCALLLHEDGRHPGLVVETA